MFSEKFVHMSPLHGALQPLTSYVGEADHLDLNISLLRMASWLNLVATQLGPLNESSDSPFAHALRPFTTIVMSVSL
jgi:hypothetical protein